MPARLSSMELSPSPQPDTDDNTQSRRKSGRITKRPQNLNSSNDSGFGKRKRANGDDVPDDSADDDGLGDSQDEEEEEEDEPEDDEFQGPRRKARRTNTGKSKAAGGAREKISIKPSASLAIRSATSVHSRRIRKSASGNVGGLYGEIFGASERLDDISANWLARCRANESEALSELVNLVLRCTGCEIIVTAEEMEDPDNCPNRLGEIQDEFQALAVADYPLIARGKGSLSFKRSLSKFFESFVKTIAEADLLYDETQLIENVLVWVGTLSSASSRPFRHTSTIVAFSILNGFCEVGGALLDNRAKLLRQVEGEQKKRRVNKARVNDLQQKAADVADRLAKLNALIKEWDDVVFVHRYRDIDPKIRADSIAYLSTWILNYPDYFFDDDHVRYLGWVLSDPNAATRLEVLKQLQKLFKDKDRVTGLKQFTERFRSRIVEIAIQDTEPNVRVAAIELLDTLRDIGLLEPNNIDEVGKLVFDTEQRVRRAVVPFFAANVEDVFDSKVEEIGGMEIIRDAFGEDGESDLNKPQLKWLKFKSLAELLHSYDAAEEDRPVRKLDSNLYLFARTTIDSRFGMAAEALMEHLEEVQEWESLAAYILFDHSQSMSAKNNNSMASILGACRPEDKEEFILLEVLHASVKHGLIKGAEVVVDKKIKKDQRIQILGDHEIAAHHLAVLIPKLLKKFGAMPETASAVLRLERVLNLDIFQALRQDSTTFSTFLDDINKQFMSHENQEVLAEASAAILHAKSFEELEEITDEKLQNLWEDSIHTLISLCQGQTMTGRGNLGVPVVTALSNTVRRMSNLSSISSSTVALETPNKPKSDRRKRQAVGQSTAALPLLISIIHRGTPAQGLEAVLQRAEDDLVTNTCKCLLFYFMWKTSTLRTSLRSGNTIAVDELNELAEHQENTFAALRAVLQKRTITDDLRLVVAGTLLDLHTLFTTIRYPDPAKSARSMSISDQAPHLALISTIDTRTQAFLLQAFIAMERTFAKKTRRTLEPPDVDDDPEGSDDEDDGIASEDDVTADEDDTTVARRASTSALLTEEKLCSLASKMVLAMLAGVLDPIRKDIDSVTEVDGGFRKRFMRNRARLGPNFKEVCAFLERGGLPVEKKAMRARADAVDRGGAAVKQIAKSAEVVDDEDEDEDDEGEVELEIEGEGDDVEAEEARAQELLADEGDGGSDADMASPHDEQASMLGD